MPLYAENARLPEDATEDISYVRSNFRPMDNSSEALVESGLLPKATYVLPDGTPMVPVDHTDLLEAAGHDPAHVEDLFIERYVTAGGRMEDAAEEYQAWLSGEYGACLRQVTPEMIQAKGSLMQAISALLAIPTEDDPVWRAATRAAVDALDAIELPFAAYDRVRFGSPSSRDRLITATHERFPNLWDDDGR